MVKQVQHKGKTYEVDGWMERGEARLTVTAPDGKTLLDLDAEGISEAIEDGFLPMMGMVVDQGRVAREAVEWAAGLHNL
jgi:hypothetical protein